MKIKLLVCFWILFVFVHTVNILHFPIFEDEAEYLLLADAIIKDPGHNLFIYSQNGLFPLYGWTVALVTFILHDSLLSGRLINVLSASTLVFWIYKVAKLYKLPSQFEWVAQCLLLTSPIILLNSHIALLDPSVMVYTAWYIYFTDYYIRNHTNRSGISIIFTFLGAILTKATGVFGIPSVMLIIFSSFKVPLKKKVIINSISVFVLSFLSIFVYFLYFSKQITTDSGSSIFLSSSLPDFITFAKLRVLVTSHWILSYYLPFLTIPFFLIFTKGKLVNTKLFIIMSSWVITSLLIMILLNRYYFPRHILIISVPLIIILSLLINRFKKPISLLIFGLAILFQLGVFIPILENPQKAHLALEDKFEYFENYTSGSRINDISSYLISDAGGKEVVVWLDGSYVMEYGLKRALSPNFSIKSFRLNENYIGIEPGLISKDQRPAYVVINRWKPKNFNELKLLSEFPVSFRHTQFVYQIP